MKIYYEDSMPYAKEFFADIAECSAFSGRTVKSEDIADADALLVRSTTKVNAELIAQCANLKFVATATAGFNHLDLAYLSEREIPVYIAAGCNAIAVAEYVLSALYRMHDGSHESWTNKTVGIVGAGQVGTALSRKLDALGVQYKLCDPPLADSGDKRDLVDMSQIMACDIISLHVPLVTTGPYPTLNLFDEERLGQLREQQILINACRGEVISNQALLALFERGRQLQTVLDVWENEPTIEQALVPYVALATPHIAGHSIEGKARGTEMVYQAYCQRFNLTATKSLDQYLPQATPAEFILDTNLSEETIGKLVCEVYDILEDDKRFRAGIKESGGFERLRKQYPVRREFSAYRLIAGTDVVTKRLYELGFSR